MGDGKTEWHDGEREKEMREKKGEKKKEQEEGRRDGEGRQK